MALPVGMQDGRGGETEARKPEESKEYPPGYGRNVPSSAEGAFAVKTKLDKVELGNVFLKAIERVPAHADAVKKDKEYRQRVLDFFVDMPKRYVLDVNVDSPDTILMHVDLMQQSRKCEAPAYCVLKVQQDDNGAHAEDGATGVKRERRGEPAQQQMSRSFSSSPNLVALLDKSDAEGSDDEARSEGSYHGNETLYEVTVVTENKGKVLSKLLSYFSLMDLNVLEAHAFCAASGMALDVFVVDGWSGTAASLQEKLYSLEPSTPRNHAPQHLLANAISTWGKSQNEHEIEMDLLNIGKRFSSGAFGDLYRGSYKGQEVAIKMIRQNGMNASIIKEFKQEVSIMRMVDHPNIVKFVGAGFSADELIIVSEFMQGGNVYNYLHKRSQLKLYKVISFAIDVAKGLKYLHSKNIVHRDIKSANLLLDETHQTVKLADFGVAKLTEGSVDNMTAETGTYRWMAPEVIAHRNYNTAADVYSFGITLYEFLTSLVPYAPMSPIQAAMDVCRSDLRPSIPRKTPLELQELMRRCWAKEVAERPEIKDVLDTLLQMQGDKAFQKPKRWGGFFGNE